MSRESEELGEKQHNEQFGVQPGNPDHVGYPGEDPLPDYQNKDEGTLGEISL
jgi:hypothetical protein